MAGILYDGRKAPGVESSGVYKGILVEDMIDTVRNVKKPFIDVFIEDLFFKDADYPLTYVPMFNMVLPLKKDQEVWVYFNQENHRYPVLWKLADDVTKEYTENLELPTKGSLVSFPNAEDTTEVTKFSDSCWFIGTKSYGVFHWGEQCVLLNDDSIITNAKSKLHYKSGGDFTVEAADGIILMSDSGFKVESSDEMAVKSSANIQVESQNDITVESSAGKILLKGTSINLGKELHDAFETLATTSPSTQGSPAAQVLSPAIISKLLEVVAKIATGFKE